MLVYYNTDKIAKTLGDIDKQIEELQIKRTEVIEKRLNKAMELQPRYKRKLDDNIDAQAALISSHKTLSKLQKLTIQLEKLKALQEEMDKAEEVIKV